MKFKNISNESVSVKQNKQMITLQPDESAELTDKFKLNKKLEVIVDEVKPIVEKAIVKQPVIVEKVVVKESVKAEPKKKETTKKSK